MMTSIRIDFLARVAVESGAAFAILLGACSQESSPTGPSSGLASSRQGEQSPAAHEDARRPPDSSLSARQRNEIKALEAIGYAAGIDEGREAAGVTIHDASRAQAGLNFFTSGHRPVAILMDMSGKIVHEWSCEVGEVWPDKVELAKKRGGRYDYFRRARVEENGDVFAIFAGIGLVKLNVDSGIEWHYAGNVHHDILLGPEGRVCLLEREAFVVPWISEDRPILDDYVVVLDPRGNELDRLSLLSCMKRSPLAQDFEELIRTYYAERRATEARLREENDGYLAERPELAARIDLAGDIFHTNSLRYLDGSQAHLSPHFEEGNLLLSLRSLDLLVILDPRERSMVWMLSGRWHLQHEPVLLANGRILLFDNQGPSLRGDPDHSEALEIDALSGEVVWAYRAPEKHEFFSMIAGTCQRLENGNTLIAESVRGRALEVTRAGEIVWEFQSPYRAGEENQHVAFLPDIQRMPPGFGSDWLKR